MCLYINQALKSVGSFHSTIYLASKVTVAIRLLDTLSTDDNI